MSCPIHWACRAVLLLPGRYKFGHSGRIALLASQTGWSSDTDSNKYAAAYTAINDGGWSSSIELVGVDSGSLPSELIAGVEQAVSSANARIVIGDFGPEISGAITKRYPHIVVMDTGNTAGNNPPVENVVSWPHQEAIDVWVASGVQATNSLCGSSPEAFQSYVAVTAAAAALASTQGNSPEEIMNAMAALEFSNLGSGYTIRVDEKSRQFLRRRNRF